MNHNVMIAQATAVMTEVFRMKTIIPVSTSTGITWMDIRDISSITEPYDNEPFLIHMKSGTIFESGDILPIFEAWKKYNKVYDEK